MAETVITGLNQSDRDKIQGLLDESAERLGNAPYRDRPGWEPGDTTEVYIAKAPTAQEEPPGGIPALTVQTGGFDRPGYAKCRVYRISPSSSGVPELRPIEDKKLRVYNLTQTAIAPGTWVAVQRSKSGHWLAQLGGGQNTEPVEVTATQDGPYYVGYKLVEFSANPPRFRRGAQIRVLNLADATISP